MRIKTTETNLTFLPTFPHALCQLHVLTPSFDRFPTIGVFLGQLCLARVTTLILLVQESIKHRLYYNQPLLGEISAELHNPKHPNYF